MRPQLVGGGFGAQFSQPRHPDGECDIEPELAAPQVHRGGGKREFGKLFFKGHADLAGTRTQKSEGSNRASAPFCGSRWRSTWASIKVRASRLEKPAASATCSKSSTCRLQTARSVALSRASSAPRVPATPVDAQGLVQRYGMAAKGDVARGVIDLNALHRGNHCSSCSTMEVTCARCFWIQKNPHKLQFLAGV